MSIGKFLVAVLVLGCVAPAIATDRPAEQLVRERCRKCHGTNGLSGEAEFPKLAGQNVDYLTRQMANFKTGVRTSKRMRTRVNDLSGGEMRALAEYFSEKPMVPETGGDPVQVDLGRHIYFSGIPAKGVTACTTCHGPQGRGAMYLPRLAGQHAQYLASQLRAFRDHSRSSPNMVMHTVVENIADPEIESVALFLSVME
ncbi:c-type cytochrome [Aromatoleum toluvorans]|uniref:C-type cytochrome n=1 Tax=Aromatoleum toluvorans TaxID=92002 RepID=A0ABX1Q470_9RHOO|nr:c-type cytochrome [Aromatoleum toluvorans]NMG45156.1 c-type cytochrome [Aromatoleum toluvorans]